jgi:hypothetical protein
MGGGIIGGNTAHGSGFQGGGVFVSNTGTFVMSGGTVYGLGGANPNTAGTGASLYRAMGGVARWGNGTYHTGGDLPPGTAPNPNTTDFIVGSGGANNTNDTLTARTP